MKIKSWIFFVLIYVPWIGPKLIIRFFCKKPEDLSKGDVYRVLYSEESDDRYSLFSKINEIDGVGVEMVKLPTRLFQAVYDFYLSDYLHPIHKHPSEYDALEKKRYHSDRARYARTINRIIDIIEKVYRPNVYVSASIGDARWRFMIGEVTKRGWKWIITEREGVISPVVYDKNPPFVIKNNVFDYSYMFLSNERHLEYWKKIDQKPERLEVMGELKSDFWFRDEKIIKSSIHKSLDNNKQLLLYFAFGNYNYIGKRFWPNENYEWKKLQVDHYSLLVEFAKTHPDVQVVLKGGHPGDLNIGEDLKVEIQKLIDKEKIILLSQKYRAIDLIKVADVIMGLQTTALIESMFTNKIIAYAGWGNVHDEVKHTLLPFYKSPALHSLESPAECLSFLEDCFSGKVSVDENMQRERASFRERYFFQANGDCHKRLLSRIIKKFPKRRHD